jgi:threonine dehydratase
VKSRKPGARIVGCQHRESPSLALSLERGCAVTRLPGIDTLAGGIEGGIGAANFEVIRERIDAVALLTERQIWEATAWMLAEHQHLVEPSAAVTVAACLDGQVEARGPTAVVLSGRNVSLDALRRILAAV